MVSQASPSGGLASGRLALELSFSAAYEQLHRSREPPCFLEQLQHCSFCWSPVSPSAHCGT